LHFTAIPAVLQNFLSQALMLSFKPSFERLRNPAAQAPPAGLTFP
jgi:hypothetical protein